MRQEKGITMVSLVITILILVVLVGVGIYSASPIIGKATAEDLTTELMLIQAKWKVEREKVNFDGDSSLDSQLIIGEGEGKGKLIEEYQTQKGAWAEDGDNTTYYQLPQEALNAMGLGMLKAENKYIVNYDNDEIIYGDGFDAEDKKTYYKLSDIKEL